jgi:hypothetical protein
MSEDLRDPDRAVDFIIANAGKLASDKANRVYLEEFRKSKKAILRSWFSLNGACYKLDFRYHPPCIDAACRGKNNRNP